jgi:hypothetical protein
MKSYMEARSEVFMALEHTKNLIIVKVSPGQFVVAQYWDCLGEDLVPHFNPVGPVGTLQEARERLKLHLMV